MLQQKAEFSSARPLEPDQSYMFFLARVPRLTGVRATKGAWEDGLRLFLGVCAPHGASGRIYQGMR